MAYLGRRTHQGKKAASKDKGGILIGDLISRRLYPTCVGQLNDKYCLRSEKYYDSVFQGDFNAPPPLSATRRDGPSAVVGSPLHPWKTIQECQDCDGLVKFFDPIEERQRIINRAHQVLRGSSPISPMKIDFPVQEPFRCPLVPTACQSDQVGVVQQSWVASASGVSFSPYRVPE